MIHLIHTLARHATALVSTAWLARRLLALALAFLPSAAPQDIQWIAVPLGGGTGRIQAARRLAEDHLGARLVLAGTAVEVEAAQRWLADANLPVESFVIEPGTTYACTLALRQAVGDAPGVLVTDGSHVLRARISWVLSGGFSAPPAIQTTPARLTAEEAIKLVGYLVRH